MKTKLPSTPSRLKKFMGEVGKTEESLVEMMMILIRTLEERDSYTRGHSERVGHLAYLIGQEMGFPKIQLEKLRRGGMLHDIGKIGITDELLYKPGTFSQDERARMNQHPEKGHLIVVNCHLLWDLIPMIRNHHENFDGSGYPDGLKGEIIPIEVRIVSLSDYFDALVTARPYKEPYSKEKSLAFVKSMTGIKFDPAVINVFLKIVDAYYDQNIKPIL